MNESIDIKDHIEFTSVSLVKGNYEGYDYYKIVAETASGFKLQTKLTCFEYNTLKKIITDAK